MCDLFRLLSTQNLIVSLSRFAGCSNLETSTTEILLNESDNQDTDELGEDEHLDDDQTEIKVSAE